MERNLSRSKGAAGGPVSGLAGAATLAWAAPVVGRNDAKTQRTVVRSGTSRERAESMSGLQVTHGKGSVMRRVVAYSTFPGPTMLRAPRIRPAGSSYSPAARAAR